MRGDFGSTPAPVVRQRNYNAAASQRTQPRRDRVPFIVRLATDHPMQIQKTSRLSVTACDAVQETSNDCVAEIKRDGARPDKASDKSVMGHYGRVVFLIV